MNLFQALLHHVGIDLCGRDIRMSQHGLHGTQIRTILEQVRCEGMSQHVRIKRLC